MNYPSHREQWYIAPKLAYWYITYNIDQVKFLNCWQHLMIETNMYFPFLLSWRDFAKYKPLEEQDWQAKTESKSSILYLKWTTEWRVHQVGIIFFSTYFSHNIFFKATLTKSIVIPTNFQENDFPPIQVRQSKCRSPDCKLSSNQKVSIKEQKAMSKLHKRLSSPYSSRCKYCQLAVHPAEIANNTLKYNSVLLGRREQKLFHR